MNAVREAALDDISKFAYEEIIELVADADQFRKIKAVAVRMAEMVINPPMSNMAILLSMAIVIVANPIAVKMPRDHLETALDAVIDAAYQIHDQRNAR